MLRPSLTMRVLTLVVVAGVVTGCATNPVTGKRELSLMSEAQEIDLGRQSDPEIRRELGEYQDEALQRYVADIGMRLARSSERPQLPWQFIVVDSPAVNAFALPGGFVYVTRGILPYLSSEADLAGVLGHEVGHVTARHAAQHYTKGAFGQLGVIATSIFVPSVRPFGDLMGAGLGVLFMKYGRDDEIEADRLGVNYVGAERWDPHGVSNMLTTLARIAGATDRKGVPNWLSTHPDPATRVTRVGELVATTSASRADWVVGRDEYLERINGLLFGDNPEEGIVRDSLFLHPDLRVSVQFPEDWTINNGKEQVVARSPVDEHFMFLRLVERTRGAALDQVALASMAESGLRAQQADHTTVNGLPAVMGVYEGSVRGFGRATVRALHVTIGRRVFAIAGAAKPEAFAAADPQFVRSLGSVRELTSAEAAAIQPNRIALYVTRRGDSWQSIAARQGGNVVRASTLAIMNGRAVNQQPEPGDRVKIVVAG